METDLTSPAEGTRGGKPESSGWREHRMPEGTAALKRRGLIFHEQRRQKNASWILLRPTSGCPWSTSSTSTSNQLDVIRADAKRRGLEIVKLYSDERKRGLNIQGQDSLAQMIK